MTRNIEKCLLLVLSFLVLTAFAPGLAPVLYAQGNQFYSCTDPEGKTVITNRLYDSASFRCVPFVALNKEFTEDEARQSKRAPQGGPIRAETELTPANARAAQLSAESARVAMEAAHASAVAAQITAEAVRTALQPDFIIITPQSSVSVVDRRFFMPGFR